MSIALFNEPIEVEITSSATVRSALMLGIDSNTDHDYLIVVEADGAIRWIDASKTVVATKWRYDEQLHEWIDLSGPPAPEEPTEDTP
jgi:hypothetical protein